MLGKLGTIAVAVLSLQFAGCASTATQNQSQMGNLLLAEPLSVDYRNEVKLARLNEILNQVEIDDDQRAVLYYQRGVIFDSLGLRGMSRLDFTRALSLRPDIANAYNFIGIHKTQLQQFSEAYEDFDAVLDLDPQHQFAYLNRGIALHYGGRHELALSDMQVFHQQQPDDAYRILWLYIIEREVDAEQALARLRDNSAELDPQMWTTFLVKLFLNDISETEFLATLGQGILDNKSLASQLCEAYFYLGKYSQYYQRDGQASNYFKLSLSTNVYEFVEHRYAKLELDLMRQEKDMAENGTPAVN